MEKLLKYGSNRGAKMKSSLDVFCRNSKLVYILRQQKEGKMVNIKKRVELKSPGNIYATITRCLHLVAALVVFLFIFLFFKLKTIDMVSCTI